MSKDSHIRARLMTVVVASAMVLSLLLVSSGKTGAHTGDWIDSAWTTSPPTIDGSMAAGEWSDAASADLGAIPGNVFPAYLLVKNDANYLYIAYDAVGDLTTDANDGAAVSFDTGHDTIESLGAESEFFWGPAANNGQEHLVYDGMNMSIEDSPFDTGLPDHAGLAGAYGYGPSDLGMANHRIYELQIPLVLLHIAPAEVIGFLGASQPAPGLMDASSGYDCWPAALTGPPSLSGYGDLRIGRAPRAADLDMNPPSQIGSAVPSSSTNFTITVINRGTANDVFEMQVMSVWTTSLLDSGGVNPLVDTDGDLVPDTGSVGPGANVQIIVQVITPASGTCDDALVTGTSANDPSVLSTAIVRTCMMAAALNPPHSDYGVDLTIPPNGYFDELWINVGVLNTVADTYEVIVYLYDPTDISLITAGFNYSSLSIGAQVVSVQLSGQLIYASGFDGQYVAHIDLYDWIGNLLDQGIYVTSAYMHTDFDPPGALLNPPHSDFGVDMDFPPNGLYDELWINIGVMVNTDGWYDVAVGLFDPSEMFMITSSDNYTYLLAGAQVVSVFLPGLAIYNSGFDGQYVAYIYVYDDMGNPLDNGRYVTSPYLHTDFDGPNALLNPPHSDSGVDTDFPPNGLFNELWINVGIANTVDAWYEVSVSLYDSSGFFYITSASNYTFLAAGTQIVSVALSGLDIYYSGFDGSYEADIYLYDDMMNLLDTGIYLTSSYLHTDFDGPNALLNPPHSDSGVDTDFPPNGLFNELVINVGVANTVDAWYEIGVALYDSSGFFYITSGYNYTFLTAGTQVVSVALTGRDIFYGGFDGPYEADIYLYDDMMNLLDSSIYMTSPYLHTDFDGPGATFNPPYYDYGIDTDVPPNGLYDELVIAVNVSVTQAGTYTVGGELYDRFMTYIMYWSSSVYMDLGNNVVPLTYPGSQIFIFGLDGPYTARLYLLDTNATIDTDSYTTGTYSHTDFDPPAGVFAPPHSDQGIDLTVPPDGLYEFLELDIKVDVGKAATFDIAVDLYDWTGSYILSTDAIVDLSVGMQTVPVRLDGAIIRNSGLDGPYEADLYLFSNSTMLDFDMYMTQAYLASDFSTVGAAFQPPYSDRIVDADTPPDGLADFLLVDVNIDVSIQGSYLVTAVLTKSGTALIDLITQRQWLPLGMAVVTLSFDGHKIADSGFDGPYDVFLMLYDEYQRLIDTDVYMTAVHAASQFEPSDSTPPVSTVGAVSYWKNKSPLDVPFTASDPSPTDGLNSVTLYYRYSTDNSSWDSWTAYASALVSGNTANGAIPFTFPAGTGFYEFQMIAVDAAGNREPLGSAETQVAYLPIAELRFQPDPLPLTAGHQGTLTISPLSTGGQPARLEASLVINLETWSPTGEYRTVGTSTAITTMTIPAGSASASVDYYDTAAGIWTLLGYTSDGVGGMSTANVIAASAASITVDPQAITIEVTQTQTFTAIVKDAYGNSMIGTSVTWDVSSSLGTVDATGRFTAGTMARSGTITARSDSIQGSADIILTPGPAAGIEVTPDSATIQSGTEVTIIAEVVDAYGNVINAASVTWTVSGPGTVSPGSGATTTVTANGAGAISVTATLGSLSATATFTSVDTGGGLSSIAIAGIAGSLIGGILIGFAVGWILHKRRTKPQQPAQMQVPPPPPANFPPAQPPQPPQGT